jgi:hypothetical protein
MCELSLSVIGQINPFLDSKNYAAFTWADSWRNRRLMLQLDKIICRSFAVSRDCARYCFQYSM